MINKLIKNIFIALILIILINLSFNNFYAKTFGGQVITGSKDDGSCTAGFNAVNEATGQKYLVTAGHCFDKGEDIYDQKTKKKIGTVETNFYTDGKIVDDIEFIKLIDNSNNPYILDGQSNFITPVISYMSKEEVETLDKPESREYKYFTYSSENNIIYPLSFETKVLFSSDYSTTTTAPMLEFTVQNNSRGGGIIDDGVSGAPVYQYDQGGVELVGIVAGTYRSTVPDFSERLLVQPAYYSAPIYKPQTI